MYFQLYSRIYIRIDTSQTAPGESFEDKCQHFCVVEIQIRNYTGFPFLNPLSSSWHSYILDAEETCTSNLIRVIIEIGLIRVMKNETRARLTNMSHCSHSQKSIVNSRYRQCAILKVERTINKKQLIQQQT